MPEDLLRIGQRTFRSRLFVGTGKYPSLEIMKQALEASGAEVVTVAVRQDGAGRAARRDAPGLH